MLKKLKLAIFYPEKKWYLQTWFICILFSLWIFIIPFFIGVFFLIRHYINNYHRNIKYGEFDKMDEKLQELTSQIETLTQEKSKTEELKQSSLDKLQNEISELCNEKQILQEEINTLNKDLTVQYSNVSDYLDISSQEIKNKLNLLKLEQDKLIKDNKAIAIDIVQDKNNTKVLNSNVKQLLRSFNSECNSIIGNLTIKNVDSTRGKLEKSYTTLNKLYESDHVKISEKLYELKLQELTLVYSYIQQLENEKEQQKAIREQLVEEAKVRKEIEIAKSKIEKEEHQFKNEISKLMSYLNKTNVDVEKQLYVDKIRELEEKLKLLEKDKANVLQREQNTRAGFVYIISNIGSFGENVYKIGMTRRLEPMERIKELSDASVPFSFDVHALIFSDDAPALETILHKTFKNHQVNKLNSRKEFYNIDLNEIKEVVKNNYNNTVNFTDYAEAYEYREGLKLKDVI